MNEQRVKRGVRAQAQLSTGALFIATVAAGGILAAGAPSGASPVSAASSPAAKAPAPEKPVLGRPAPDFTLTDVENHARSLKEFRGRPVVVYFFCGCPACHEVASSWSALQRGGALPTAPAGSPAPSPTTVVVFQGDAGMAKTFAQETQLDLKKTVLLTDPQIDVTEQYGVDPCPRAFVIDPFGTVRYTNDHADDAPQKAPAAAIVEKALDAVQTATPPGPNADANKTAADAPVKKTGESALQHSDGDGPPPFPKFEKVSPTNQLTVLAQDGVEQMTPFAGRRWFPLVDPMKTPTVEQVFTLRNNNPTPVTITRLYVPCTCTGAMLTKDGKSVKVLTLQPGEQTEVKVAIKANSLKPGTTSEYIVAYQDDSPNYIAVMGLSVRNQDLIHFSEDNLDFGKVTKGQTPSIKLTTIIDDRLLHGEQPARLQTDNPDLEVNPADTETLIQYQGRKSVKQTYTIRLKRDAALGLVRGTIFFFDKKPTTQPREYAAPVYVIGSFVSLYGEVVGTISTMPKIISFGKLTTGQSTSAKIQLSGADSTSLEGLKITCTVPSVKVSMIEETALIDSISNPSRNIELTINKDAPLGNMKGEVLIETKSGEKLYIPVMGYITPRK